MQQTRERLLFAARDFLMRQGGEALTLPALARAASVSAPTVYRHFPTLDALYAAFLEWIRPQVGQTRERLLGRGPQEVARLPLENFPLYEEHAVLLRALIDSRAFNQVRVGSMKDRRRAGADVLRSIAKGWSHRELEGAAGALYALSSPQVWRWLRETWGLDADTASAAAAWAMGALVRSIAQATGMSHKALGVASKKRKNSARARAVAGKTRGG